MDAAPLLLRFCGETIGWEGTPALVNLDLDLRRGERLVLLGRSGSGKSTLIGAMRTRLETAGGPRVALVSQDHGLVPQLSVHHNAWMGRLDDHGTLYNLANLVWPFPAARRATAPWLAEVGLGDMARRRVETLSGGQKQRTALARALCRGGEVALADEPISALDPTQGAALLDRLAVRFPTLVLALHDTGAALRVATRIVGLKGGRIVLDASARDVTSEALASLYAR